MKSAYGCPEKDLFHYTCYRTPRPLLVDGRLDKESWKKAPQSPRFVDLVTGVPGFLDTRMAALWDDDYFYAGFWVEEPNYDSHIPECFSFIHFSERTAENRGPRT